VISVINDTSRDEQKWLLVAAGLSNCLIRIYHKDLVLQHNVFYKKILLKWLHLCTEVKQHRAA
jgi:hypothetical protein